jgi:hypothetical protein
MASGASGSQRPEDRKPGDDPPDLPEEFLQYRDTPPPRRPGAPEEQPDLYIPERRVQNTLWIWLVRLLVIVFAILLLGSIAYLVFS